MNVGLCKIPKKYGVYACRCTPPVKWVSACCCTPGLVVYACRCTPKVETLGRRSTVGRCKISRGACLPLHR